MKAEGLMVCVVMAVTGCTRGDSQGASREPVGETTLTSAAVTPAQTESFLEPDPLATRRVEVALADDPLRSMAAKNVEVTVDRGVARLEGTVQDVASLGDIAQTVATVPGVDRVDNRLEVSRLRDRDRSESDERISFALQRSLSTLAASGNDVDRITIDVVGGHVHLRGKTATEDTRLAIEQLAERTPGVVSMSDEVALY